LITQFKDRAEACLFVSNRLKYLGEDVRRLPPESVLINLDLYLESRIDGNKLNFGDLNNIVKILALGELQKQYLAELGDSERGQLPKFFG
jgi:hypothetical protein